MIERGGATLLIGVRLIPIVPFSLVCYAAGAARVPLWRFVWTTAVGYLPITALSVYFGTRLEGLSLTDPLVLGSAAGAAGAAARRPLGDARGAAAAGLSAQERPTRFDLEAEDGRRRGRRCRRRRAPRTGPAWRPALKRRTRRVGQKRRGRRRSGR